MDRRTIVAQQRELCSQSRAQSSGCSLIRHRATATARLHCLGSRHRLGLPRGGTQAPRGLGTALNTVETEDEVLSQLQGIMHADDQEVQPNPSTQLADTDEFDFEVEVDEERGGQRQRRRQ